MTCLRVQSTRKGSRAVLILLQCFVEKKAFNDNAVLFLAYLSLPA